jgi:hypothetical protein
MDRKTQRGPRELTITCGDNHHKLFHPAGGNTARFFIHTAAVRRASLVVKSIV